MGRPSLLQGIFLAIPQYKTKVYFKKIKYNILLQKKKKLFEIIEVEDNRERNIEEKKMYHIYLHEGLYYGIKQS